MFWTRRNTKNLSDTLIIPNCVKKPKYISKFNPIKTNNNIIKKTTVNIQPLTDDFSFIIKHLKNSPQEVQEFDSDKVLKRRAIKKFMFNITSEYFPNVKDLEIIAKIGKTRYIILDLHIEYNSNKKFQISFMNGTKSICILSNISVMNNITNMEQTYKIRIDINSELEKPDIDKMIIPYNYIKQLIINHAYKMNLTPIVNDNSVYVDWF